MFDFFHFSLPRAVTEQLIERLDQMAASALDDQALECLKAFQVENKSAQGVYVIFLAKEAVYAGKAVDLEERLSLHFLKLRGRKGINLSKVGFKALLLDENWSTSANEDLLIKHFKTRGQCRWNGNGFGPKDPGKNRDGSEPSWFDDNYPVKEDFVVRGISNEMSILDALAVLKEELPYLFRYEVPRAAGQRKVDLSAVPRTAVGLARHITQALGAGWQLMLFKNGFTLYPIDSKGVKHYAHGTQLLP